MAVERDVLEHWGECPEHSFAASGERGTVDPTYTSGPGVAQTTRDPADRWRVDMVQGTSVVNSDAIGGGV